MKLNKPLLLTAIFSSALSLKAQFSIPWSTINGGGGQTSGGSFSLHGTIGQADAGAASGGVYAMTGGFWAVPFHTKSYR